MDYRLVSSNRVIAEMFSDFNITNTDWTNKAYRFIEKAISIMGIDGYYIKNAQELNIIDYKYEIPCDAKNIITLLDTSCNAPSRIPLRDNYLLNNYFKSMKVHGYKKGYVEGNYLKVNFEEGQAVLLYLSIPKDNNGFPMIPDNDLVLEALPFYIIMRLGYSGYIHPVISRQEAEAKWREYYPIARNNVNFPSIEEMQSFTEMNNNPLLGDYYNSLFNH